MDILDYLEADQDALRSLIVEFRIADEESAHEAEAFTALVSAAKVQSEAQEAVLIPLALGSETLRTAIQPTLERIAGAREVEKMIECCTNRATWRSSVNIYCEMLENGMEEETKRLLPALFDHVSVAERRKLGTNYKKLRGFRAYRSNEKPTDWQSLWAFVISQAG